MAAMLLDAFRHNSWATAELLLAPLGPGDYVVEVVAGDTRTMAAFRIVL